MQFCDEHHVPYVQEGANVSKDNINIQCPFCPDPSEHLGLSLNPKRPSWGCWRCKKGGNSPLFLVSTLLGNRKLAERAVEDQQDKTADDFDTLLDGAQEAPQRSARSAKELPSGLRALDVTRTTARSVTGYLESRGFDDVQGLAEAYGLLYALTGDYAQRVTLPVYFEGKLVSWVGRAISNTAKVRYKTEDSGDLKRVVANYDVLLAAPPTRLAVSEGPMDFLKLDYYGRARGLRATCLFGTRYTPSQLMLLRRLAKRHGLVVIFDPEAAMAGAQLAEELSEIAGHTVENWKLEDAEDPGALTKGQVRSLAKQLK